MATFNYGITIKNIKTDYHAQEHELLILFEQVIKRHHGIYVDHTYEYDSIDRLHLHGHFLARKGIRLNLFKVPYWHFHIDPLPTLEDLKVWQGYMHKDEFKKFMETYHNGDYLFVENLKSSIG